MNIVKFRADDNIMMLYRYFETFKRSRVLLEFFTQDNLIEASLLH